MSRLTKDESDVRRLSLNPFTLSNTPLSNLKSGQVASSEVAEDLAKAVQRGSDALRDFLQARINKGERFYDPLKQNHLKTFASLKKKTATRNGKLENTCDRELFSRLVIVAQTRKFDLQELFTYELTNVPLAIATTDGCMRKTDKSVLMKVLEDDTTPVDRFENTEKLCVIFDLMAVIQASATLASTSTSFCEYAKSLLRTLLSRARCAERIDIVCDRYEFKESTKHSERIRRTRGTEPLSVTIHGPSTPIPRQWNRYLAQKENKSTLANFLQTQWLTMGDELKLGQVLYIAGCSNTDNLVCKAVYSTGFHEDVEDLSCSHEEADTRMIFHASHAFDHGQRKVLVYSPDTDVFILCLSVADRLTGEIIFCTGVGDKRRYIDVTDLSRKLGAPVTRNLVAMHALTGCDTTSSFFGIGKKTAFDMLKKCSTLLEELGSTFDPTPEVYQHAEEFIVCCYSKGHSLDSSVNIYRYK